MTTRSYHHGDLRATLLRHAESALASGEELSLRSLARQAGVSHGAPRRHFADKQALLDALALDGFERLGAALDAVPPDTDLRSRLLAFGRAYVDFAMRHAALLDLMFTGKHRGEAIGAAADEAFAASLAVFADGQAAGEIVPGDTERLGFVAFAAFHGLASLATSGMLAADELDATVEATADRLILGLAPR